jgi:DNA-binding NtrC family response regulator
VGAQSVGQVESDTAFDVLCTDAVMPGEPVTHVVQRFNERYPDRPILVVSGYLPEDLGPELRANEQVRLLFKPIAQERLIQAVAANAQAFAMPAQS